MDYVKCNHCKKRLTHTNLDHYWWCDHTCRSAQEKERLDRCKETNSRHNPPALRGEVDHTNDLIKAMLRQEMVTETVEEGKPKSGRKCGKCGQAGHNARTCKQK